ncbi:hypothetical protein ACHAXT_004053, partial [Thalassiosira profunda]
STATSNKAMGGDGDEECVELTASGGYEGDDAKLQDKSVGGQWRDKYYAWRNERYKLPRHYRLHTEENARKYSQWSVNFMITCSAVNTKMLNPNFAIMCTPGAHPDSFESTEPFGFNSATYFIPFCTLIGVALASTFIGTLSDRFGRKILLLILGWISAVGSIAKYYTKDTFWGFCACNFAFGFFLGNLPVGMAYVGDVEPSKKKKDDLLGFLVGCFVLGNSGGGIIAVLMGDVGLFAPLWVGAGLMVIANIGTHWFMIEPGDSRLRVDPVIEEKLLLEEDADTIPRPETIHKRTLWNIVGGALLDNIGSTGLFPLCLSPLALQEFYGDFVEQGEDPIMSITGYQWLSVCVALLVIPATQLTPYSFKYMGVAGTCVFGNFCTAVVTSILLWIGNAPSTELAFGMFVFVMYAGFPFTVFSQLTTGPMLDVIAPEDKIGFVQGLNNTAMNFGMACAPWAFGVLADYAGTNVAIGTGIGFSLLACVANAPLMWHPLMGKPKPKAPLAQRKLPDEDSELFQHILNGEVVDPELAFEINRDRGMHGKPSIVPRVQPYTGDRERLKEIAQGAGDSFRFRLDMYDRVLAGLAKEGRDAENLVFDKEELVQLVNTMRGEDEALIETTAEDLGKWMGQYLLDNGYTPHTASVLMKQMFMSSFPPLLERTAGGDFEANEDNIVPYLLRTRKLLARYVEQDKKNTASKTLAKSHAFHASGWW